MCIDALVLICLSIKYTKIKFLDDIEVIEFVKIVEDDFVDILKRSGMDLNK